MTARLLRPTGWLYGRIAGLRSRLADPLRLPVPVICAGNFTAGGAGKTPLALYLGRRLIAMGKRPGFLSRGYGGSLPGPHLVDQRRDQAELTGDEPLLLARIAPTVIARDRRKGAKALLELPERIRPDVIVMDDGLQNAALAKDLTIAVVDGARMLGNGWVMPAGPLRAPLAEQLGMVQAILQLSPEGTGNGAHTRFEHDFAGPVLHGAVVPAPGAEWLNGTRVVAYAGIGRPDKLFASLERAGAIVVAALPFPDHHAFRAAEAARLIDLADEYKAELVTTEKDLVRIGSNDATRELRRRSRALAVELRLEPQDARRLDTLIEAATR